MFRKVGQRASVGLGSVDYVSRPASRPAVAPAKGKSWLHGISWRVDMPLVLVLATIIIFGLVMLYSASYDYSLTWYGNPSTIFLRQLAWLALGLAMLTFMYLVDYHFWSKWIIWGLGIVTFLLVGVLATHEVRNNAVRTLFGGSVQPSELAKLVLIMYLAVWLYSKRERLTNLTLGLIPMGAILSVLGALIFLQPDLSTTLTVFIIGGLMFFLAGGDLRQIAAVIVLAAIGGALLVSVSSTGRARIQDFQSGLKDPVNASYHVKRSLESFVSGGWFGLGIGNARNKVTGLPVPPTDSIFAVVGEETGLVGAIGLITLYGLLLWRGLVIARRAPDELGALLAGGISIWIVFEAFINMAVLVNVLPFAGNALPFISSGGSNLVVCMTAMGLLLNVSRMAVKNQEENGRIFGAVVDLRRRDGRRRVSSPRRPASDA